MKNLIRKILKESDELKWADNIDVSFPTVYAVYYGSAFNNDLEGYFTTEAFDRYLSERNQEREEMGEEPEDKDEFTFKKININW
jgi:hypothetical protein